MHFFGVRSLLSSFGIVFGQVCRAIGLICLEGFCTFSLDDRKFCKHWFPICWTFVVTKGHCFERQSHVPQLLLGAVYVPLGTEELHKRQMLSIINPPNELQLQINCDGRAVFRSSSRQLWPFLHGLLSFSVPQWCLWAYTAVSVSRRMSVSSWSKSPSWPPHWMQSSNLTKFLLKFVRHPCSSCTQSAGEVTQRVLRLW